MYFSEPHEPQLNVFKGKLNVTWKEPVNIIILLFVIILIRLSFCIKIFLYRCIFFKPETLFRRFIHAGHNFCSVMPISVAY